MNRFDSFRAAVSKMAPLVIVLPLLSFAVGCASMSGRKGTVYVRPPRRELETLCRQMTIQTLTIQKATNAVPVPVAVQDKFDTMLRERLMKVFMAGDELCLTYRIVGLKTGSRFARWLVSPLPVGRGEMEVEVTYNDHSGKEIAVIRCKGDVREGVFGGSSDYAMENAVDQVVKCTKYFFRVDKTKLSNIIFNAP